MNTSTVEVVAIQPVGDDKHTDLEGGERGRGGEGERGGGGEGRGGYNILDTVGRR